MIKDPAVQQRVRQALPFLGGTEQSFDRVFFTEAALGSLPRGQLVGEQGEQCARLPLLISGTVRVYRLGENGREITLYRIESGESCILTASCILKASGRFPAFAVCETDVVAALIPEGKVAGWLAEHPPWRDFVFDLVSQRLVQVIELLDAVVFTRLETRLAGWLLRRADANTDELAIKHQELAAELGSSREVISRLLRAMEERGLLQTGRGWIRLSDRSALIEMRERG